MAFRLTFDLVPSLVAKARVEPRGLKAVCSEHHLCASATDGFRFGGVEECLSQTLASMVPAHPDVHDFGATSPGVATDTSDDFARFIPKVCPQQSSIKVARRFGVELVDAFHEEFIQLLALDVVEQHDGLGLHCA